MPDKTLRIFDESTAIITGGASGIGHALGEELARRGSAVVLADRQIELAEEVASEIRAAGGKAEAVELDVADFAAVESLVRATVDHTGRVDYIFNNAGFSIGGPIHRHTIDDWQQILDVNLRGVVNGVQAAYPLMRQQGFGHIVNTASLAGLIPAPGLGAYTTTKHAVVGLSKVLRVEAAAAGVRVSVLCPGFIRTAILTGGGKYGKYLMAVSPEAESNTVERLRPMAVNEFASKALDAIAKNHAIIVLPSWWKLLWWISRLSPAFGMFLAQKIYQNEQNMLKG